VLLGGVPPQMLAGLLCLGSGLGMAALLLARGLGASARSTIAVPRGSGWAWLGGATEVGGVLGPVLLLVGLAVTLASTASLLLNLEASSPPFSRGTCSARTSIVASPSAWC
jgi:hypothetical protein